MAGARVTPAAATDEPAETSRRLRSLGRCRWCGELIATAKRVDASLCSKRCRQAAWRAARRVAEGSQAARPMAPAPSVAALYVDGSGPYMAIPTVDPWTIERDASGYGGPHPIVAHPPCADWSRLKGLAKHVPGRRELGPLAVEQVRRWGGVLEHPAHSSLWAACDLPRPGELPDQWGGWSIAVNQQAWGHVARKPTWLYLVGIDRGVVVPLEGGEATHVVSTSRRGGDKRRCSKRLRILSPPAFAAWLVELAGQARPGVLA
jgi:hypothetical protein